MASMAVGTGRTDGGNGRRVESAVSGNKDGTLGVELLLVFGTAGLGNNCWVAGTCGVLVTGSADTIESLS